MRILGIIPARYASTRFPGKPLIDIAGQSMIMRVYEQAKKAKSLSKVIVATDDLRIKTEVENNQGKVIMTDTHHSNGTERCAEVLNAMNEDFDYVINIQGDEPLINPEQIDILSSILDGDTGLGTLIKSVKDIDQLKSSSVVKVTVNENGEALYFSRNVIPFLRGVSIDEHMFEHHKFYKHIGIYAYKATVLDEIVKLPEGILEKAESLEQLRWLESGYKVKTIETTLESPSVDTPEDLEYIIQQIS